MLSHDDMEKKRISEDSKIALVSILIFTIVNLAGGIVNDNKNYQWGSNDVVGVIPLHVFFAAFFLLTCRLKIKFRKTFRLPLIRMIFWLIIAIPLFADDESRQMAAGDFIDACNPPFCFFVNTVGLELNQIDWLEDINFQLFGIIIIGLTLYQISVLELATIIVKKLTCQTV